MIKRPTLLNKGDEIRIISPSSSIARVGGFNKNLRAKKRLEALGFQVSFGQHILENDVFYSSSIASRVADLHDAFLDEQVKAVMTTIGGNNSNELLPYIDYDLLAKHPKVFCGYSDTTSLHNAIRAKTGLATFYGPAYSSFKMDELQEYQSQSFLEAVSHHSFELKPSASWSSDAWFDSSLARQLKAGEWKAYNEGSARGTSTGGNIQTYNLQAGTTYFPEVANPVVFVEQAKGGSPLEFSSQLAQILQLHPDLAALVIGRFPVINQMSEENLQLILDKYPVLQTIPVLYDVDFGHTQPIFTLPLGTNFYVKASKDGNSKLTVL
ncbi:S66 family peptidase [Fructobacillus papyrifericola]|uniref:LD-carboxypeptidase n=1 Tax=Fructobacillus papyrifericola TaxID=2713172 RepID=A0ABS5QSA0_9LACO|nr:S66 peptidase family protein [Fructobacillus papyrifericola]MBS9336011.1 LD-carboxypeptidase [Fructobacillus papyrifericola]